MTLAAVSPEGIVWLIIIFLWGIAQIANQSKRGRSRRSGPPGRPAPLQPPMNRELREFLEQMTGAKFDIPQAPPLPEELVEEPPVVRPKPRRHSQPPRLPAPQPELPSLRTTEPPIPAPTRPPVEYGMVIPNVIVPMRAMDMPDAMRLSLSLPSLGRQSTPAKPPSLSSMDDIRKAMLYSVILGTPKGLEHSPAGL